MRSLEQGRRFLPVLIFLSVAAGRGAAGPSPEKITAMSGEALQLALAPGVTVAEVRAGEAKFELPYLRRIEVAMNAAIVTIRNEGKAPLAPRIEIGFFNAYGMRVSEGTASFEEEPVAPGGIGTQSLPLAMPALEKVFAVSSLALPGDWREIRFVGVRTPGRNAENIPLIEGSVKMREGHAQPSARPRVFGDDSLGSSHIGLSSVDARFANFGAYLQRMLEIIQVSFERVVDQGRIPRRAHGSVTVKFILDSSGRVSEIVTEPNKSSAAIAAACVEAIKTRAPYGPWTDDMKAVLGERQAMTLSFQLD